LKDIIFIIGCIFSAFLQFSVIRQAMNQIVSKNVTL